jgi:2-polyprenyl-3-methyl-5-hydroxy-6-metoxy-1,4-benzoquinol methylase
MIYRRSVDPNGDDSLAKLARWIRPGATVLEIGAAAGHFTQHLASRGCTVDVVEIDADAAHEAQRFARRAIVTDVEGDAWVAALGEVRYDCIVCADVLEHLRDGVALLARVRPLLADDGELLLSVPNVAHSALIARLIDERFDYGGEGLLDATHVHLYTWRSLAQALRESGWRVEAWDATALSLYDTEFRVSEQALDPALREALLRRPHAFVYQWLVRAVPGTADAPEVPGPTPAVASIPVRLLQADAEERLTLEHAVARRVPVGGASVALEWALAAGTRALR